MYMIVPSGMTGKECRADLRRRSADLHLHPRQMQGPHDWRDTVWWWLTQSWRRPDDLSRHQEQLPDGTIVADALNPRAVALLKENPNEYFRRTGRP